MYIPKFNFVLLILLMTFFCIFLYKCAWIFGYKKAWKESVEFIKDCKAADRLADKKEAATVQHKEFIMNRFSKVE